MFLALIFTSMQAFAAETSIPGLTQKTLVLKSSNVEAFCAAKIKPEIKTVEGREVLILDEVRFRFLWQQVNTPEETQDIEQTPDTSTLKLVTETERTVLKLKGDVIELSISSGKKDRKGIFQINSRLQPLRCIWTAKN